MKTNQILNSEDRNLLGVVIKQETATGFLNVSDLQNAYDLNRIQKGWSKRNIYEVMSSKITAERIFYLIENQYKDIKPSFSGFMEKVDKEGLIKVLKSYGLYVTKGRRENKKSWCHPHIWVLLALELNPEMYAKVIVWLTDKLIFNRVEAGTLYRPLSEQVNKILVPQVEHPKDAYREVAIALNEKVFGKHETGIRNTGTEEQLGQLAKMEEFLARSLKLGFVKTMDEVRKFINEW